MQRINSRTMLATFTLVYYVPLSVVPSSFVWVWFFYHVGDSCYFNVASDASDLALKNQSISSFDVVGFFSISTDHNK